jgi:hypothetical protein
MTTGDKRMQQLIMDECNAIAQMLAEKNRSYGNSVANNEQIFAKVDVMEAINVRIDDKLRRIKAGHEYKNEDTEMDLIGYLILKRCVRRYLHEPRECTPNEQEAEREFDWTSIPIGELSDDDLDRAADLFLAHTGASDRSTQSRERLYKDRIWPSRAVVKEGCGCEHSDGSKVLCKNSGQRDGGVRGGGHE